MLCCWLFGWLQWFGPDRVRQIAQPWMERACAAPVFLGLLAIPLSCWSTAQPAVCVRLLSPNRPSRTAVVAGGVGGMALWPCHVLLCGTLVFWGWGGRCAMHVASVQLWACMYQPGSGGEGFVTVGCSSTAYLASFKQLRVPSWLLVVACVAVGTCRCGAWQMRVQDGVVVAQVAVAGGRGSSCHRRVVRPVCGGCMYTEHTWLHVCAVLCVACGANDPLGV